MRIIIPLILSIFTIFGKDEAVRMAWLLGVWISYFFSKIDEANL